MTNCAAALLDASSSSSVPMLDNWSIKWSNRRFMLVVPFAPLKQEQLQRQNKNLTTNKNKSLKYTQ